MIESLQYRWDKLVLQFGQVLNLTGSLKDDQLNFSLDETKWSIVKIIQHLHIAESNTNIYLRKKILAGEQLRNTSLLTKVNFGILRVVMFLGIKFKAPKVVHPENRAQLDFDYQTLIQSWKKERAQIHSFLEHIDENMASKLIFKHGIGMRLNLYQMLDWMHIHIARHLKQMENIAKSKKMPK